MFASRRNRRLSGPCLIQGPGRAIDARIARASLATHSPEWIEVFFPGSAKQGSAHALSGIFHDGKSPAFWAQHGLRRTASENARRVAPSFGRGAGRFAE